MMLKTQPLCTGANWNPGGRVLSEVENSFIASLGRGANASKLCVPTQRDLVRSLQQWFKDGPADKDQGLCRVHIPSVQRSSDVR